LQPLLTAGFIEEMMGGVTGILPLKKVKQLILRKQGFGRKKRRKKTSEFFGRNKRVTTFVAPKEREISYGRKKRG
jgi:hypothetical protein